MYNVLRITYTVIVYRLIIDDSCQYLVYTIKSFILISLQLFNQFTVFSEKFNYSR